MIYRRKWSLVKRKRGGQEALTREQANEQSDSGLEGKAGLTRSIYVMGRTSVSHASSFISFMSNS